MLNLVLKNANSSNQQEPIREYYGDWEIVGFCGKCSLLGYTICPKCGDTLTENKTIRKVYVEVSAYLPKTVVRYEVKGEKK